MSKVPVSDGPWEIIEALSREVPPKPKGGGHRIDNRAAPTGIVFAQKSGIPLGDDPEGDGLRFGLDVLAALAQLTGGGVREEPHHHRRFPYSRYRSL